MFGEAACESRTGERGKYSRDGDYSLKRRGCEALAAAAAGFLRATPTTPRTVTSESAARGTKMRAVEALRLGAYSSRWRVSRAGRPKFANRQNVCYVKHVFPVKLLFSLGLGPRSTAL